MNASFHHLLSHQRILLLQGKMGTFFCRFGKFLSQEGKVVKKINLNAGDEFFYCDKQNATAYRGDVRDFYDFLSEFIQKNQIDAVVCFNDCRPHHSVAKDVCTHSNTAFFVFEEGYLRPDYITLQEHGINGYSQLDISTIDKPDYAHDKPAYTNNRFWRLCLAGIIYYTVVFLKNPPIRIIGIIVAYPFGKRRRRGLLHRGVSLSAICLTNHYKDNSPKAIHRIFWWHCKYTMTHKSAITAIILMLKTLSAR